MKSSPFLKATSVVLFISLMYIGLSIAEHKTLWTDEIYSQVGNISQRSAIDMLKGNVDEGNNFPLFYLLQKAVTQTFNYQTPNLWEANQRRSLDRFVLRLAPVVCMSLAIVAIFFFFGKYYSLSHALLSLILSLSSTLMWAYWAEARPYALWFLLTTLQSVAFVKIVALNDSKTFKWLMCINVLLCMTMVLGIMQVLLVGLLLLLVKRDFLSKIVLSVTPVIIGSFYYLKAQKLDLFFMFTPEQLIRGGYSRERLYILAIYLLIATIVIFVGKCQNQKSKALESLGQAQPYMMLSVGILISSMVLIGYLMSQASADQVGFPVSSRYFIYLTPIAIISTTYLIINVVESLKSSKWFQWPMAAVMSYFIIHRFEKVLPDITNSLHWIYK